MNDLDNQMLEVLNKDVPFQEKYDAVKELIDLDIFYKKDPVLSKVGLTDGPCFCFRFPKILGTYFEKSPDDGLYTYVNAPAFFLLTNNKLTISEKLSILKLFLNKTYSPDYSLTALFILPHTDKTYEPIVRYLFIQGAKEVRLQIYDKNSSSRYHYYSVFDEIPKTALAHLIKASEKLHEVMPVLFSAHPTKKSKIIHQQEEKEAKAFHLGLDKFLSAYQDDRQFVIDYLNLSMRKIFDVDEEILADPLFFKLFSKGLGQLFSADGIHLIEWIFDETKVLFLKDSIDHEWIIKCCCLIAIYKQTEKKPFLSEYLPPDYLKKIIQEAKDEENLEKSTEAVLAVLTDLSESYFAILLELMRRSIWAMTVGGSRCYPQALATLEGLSEGWEDNILYSDLLAYFVVSCSEDLAFVKTKLEKDCAKYAAADNLFLIHLTKSALEHFPKIKKRCQNIKEAILAMWDAHAIGTDKGKQNKLIGDIFDGKEKIEILFSSREKVEGLDPDESTKYLPSLSFLATKRCLVLAKGSKEVKESKRELKPA